MANIRNYAIQGLVHLCISHLLEDRTVLAQGIVSLLMATEYVLSGFTRVQRAVLTVLIGSALHQGIAPWGLTCIWLGQALSHFCATGGGNL